ncbi:MAG: gamma-glutamyltransferase, partial [Phycisphaerales bacterium]|nr:gamma-glutamyltransferase [Phycisphaerales bacterium]
MVVADHRLASEAGAEILRRGGNAVDAAVATCLALSVVRPDASGIGGGGFMMIHLGEHPTRGPLDTVINYRETCPGGIGPDTFEMWGDPRASRFGGRSVAVPGSIAGLLHALEQYGTLDRDAVFAPAIRLAESGFPADGHHVRSARDVLRQFESHPGWDERFGFVWSRLMREGRIEVGDTIRNPEQANALRLIAEHGPRVFYDGTIADAIVGAVRADGGVLTRQDLAGYRVVETEPIRVLWRDKSLLVMPPPSSGGIAIAQTFSLADRLDLELTKTAWPDADNAHLLVEIFKHAFADRARHLADPAFHHVPVAAMLDPEALDRVADSIDRDRASALNTYGVAPPPEDGGTSHISV